MEIVERIVAAVKEITEALDDPDLDPDLERTDWTAHRPAIDGLKARLDAEVIERLKEALAALESAEDREALRTHAAFAVSETAALLIASQVATEGSELLKRALAIAPPGPAKEELQAGAKDSRNWLLLVRARWLIRQGRRGEADKLAKALAGVTREPRLKAGADEVLNAPRPISSAPPLFTLNGFGFGLYGSRDQHPDGSYVATHCVCALFIPVFPLTAYRVLRQESNRYLFLAKERLSGFARGYRNLVVVGILAAAGLGVAQAYLGSPARQAGVAISEARALAEDGKRDEAIRAYEEAVRRWHSEAPRSTMQEGGSALAQLYAGDLPTPLTATGAQRAVRIVERWEKLPSAGRGGQAATTMVGLLQGWVGEIGTATPQASRAGLRLLAAAERIADGSRSREEVRKQRTAIQTALADSVADAWPLAALRTYAEMEEDEAALAKAGAILDRIGDRHSVWIETKAAAGAWLEAVDRAGILRDVAGRTRKRLAAAGKAHAAPARQRAVQQNTAKALGRLLAKDPADQHAAVALARLQRDAGRTRSALATIQKLDEPGWLISDAQYLLGVLYADLGRLEKAEGILEPYLAGRLAAFQEARKAYSDRSDAVRARVIRDAERGKLPSDLQAKLETASEDEGQALFAGWLAGELDADQELGDLKTAYESYADVAPASLTLGMVKLRRANAAPEKERDRLLGEAEGAFLSIREEAAGVPAYHLGLGQVYHRLGRPKEGNEELEVVLAEKDPELDLAVAAIYRELGQIGRARDLAEKVWKSGAKPASENAAATMAMMATDLDEEEQWFERANQSMPYVKTSLLRIKGERLFRAGKLDAADRTFAQVARNYAKEIKHDPVAANNAALMQQYRYMCRGDPRRLEEALDGLESALRLDPDNALVVGNLASTYAYAGAVRVLGKWFEPSLLRIDAGDATALLDALADGPLGNQVRTETSREAALRRSAELTDQQAILAPSSVDAYARALQWHVIRHDVEALGTLRERVERVSGFDTTQREELRRAYQNGEDDERLIEQLDAALGRLDLLVKAAEKKKHAPTVAAVHYLRGLRLREKSEVTGRVADAQAAVAAFRQVNRLWSTLDNGRRLAWALTELALLKAAAASEAVASHRGENVRLYTLPLLLHSMSIAPNGAEMTAALRGQAELGEATRLRRARPGQQPALMDWVLGRVAGDSELERTAARVFESEEEQIGAAVAARLDPTSKSAAMLQKLMTTKE